MFTCWLEGIALILAVAATLVAMFVVAIGAIGGVIYGAAYLSEMVESRVSFGLFLRRVGKVLGILLLVVALALIIFAAKEGICAHGFVGAYKAVLNNATK